MQAKSKGILENYNSLTDDNLVGYFSNPRKLHHLQTMGLITKDGVILDEETVRRHHAREEHQAKSKHLIAQGLVKRTVELEKVRRGKLKKKIEQLSKFELAEKIKHQSSFPLGVAYLNPADSSPPLLRKTFEKHQEQLDLSPTQHSQISDMIDHMTTSSLVKTHYRSPYVKKSRPPSHPQTTTNMHIRIKRIQRPQTAPVMLFRSHAPPVQLGMTPSKLEVDRTHANVIMTFQYLGDNVKLSRSSPQQNLVEVHQQHCRGNTICLFKGSLSPQEKFSCVSRRHHGMPLGLSLYINGLVNCRLSSCCEYKHKEESLIGGKSANFRLVSVKGGKRCYQCEIEAIRVRFLAQMEKSLSPCANNVKITQSKVKDVIKSTDSDHREYMIKVDNNNTADEYENEQFEEEEEEKYQSDFKESHNSQENSSTNISPARATSNLSPQSKRTASESGLQSSLPSIPIIKLTPPEEEMISDIVSTVLSAAIQSIEKESSLDQRIQSHVDISTSIVSTALSTAVERVDKENDQRTQSHEDSSTSIVSTALSAAVEKENDQRIQSHEDINDSTSIVSTALTAAVEKIDKENDNNLLDSNEGIHQYVKGILKKAQNVNHVAEELSKTDSNFYRTESDVSLNLSQKSSSSSSSVSSFTNQTLPQIESGRRNRLEKRQSCDTLSSNQDEEEQSKSQTECHPNTNELDKKSNLSSSNSSAKSMSHAFPS